MSQVFPITIPQLNVNDEQVLLVNWLVQQGDSVDPGDAICEVETSKAATELEAEHAGIIFQNATPRSMVRIGEPIGFIGPSLDMIEAYLSNATGAEARSSRRDAQQASPQATARAQALAVQHGIALEHVAAMGVLGTIKEADVKRYLTAQRAASESALETRARPGLPAAILDHVMHEGELSRHELSVVHTLEQSLQNLLLATIDAECDLTSIKAGIQQAQEHGTMLSLSHVVIGALGRTLPHYPRLISFRHHQQVYRYRELDVAFVARALDGRLYTPVVRGVDKLDVVQIAQACQSLAMRVNRGRVKPEDLEGPCFTVSHVSPRTVTRFVALPNRFQSAILAIAGERTVLSLRDGQVCQVPTTTLVLSYDHALCDATYASEFFKRLMEEMELVLA
jgi:pyruvate dehydrogenase E2 component (dihydrolipoamide acetyltransferase)